VWRESCSRATKERRREKEREGLPPAALLLYAAAALCSSGRLERNTREKREGVYCKLLFLK